MIGVARQPDFDSKTDQLTRIDPDILSWLKTNGALSLAGASRNPHGI